MRASGVSQLQLNPAPKTVTRRLKSRFAQGGRASLANTARQLQGNPMFSWTSRAASNRARQLGLLTSEQQAALQQLTLSGASGVRAYFNRRNGVPSMLKGALTTGQSNRPSKAGKSSSVDIATDFLVANRALLKLEEPRDELRLSHEWRDRLQKKHLRFQQQLYGVPIWGREVSVHLDANDAIYLFQGRSEPTWPNFDVTPAIAPEEASRRVRLDLGLDMARAVIAESQPELTIYAPDQGSPVLTYKVDITPSLEQRWLYFINARSGAVEHRLDNIHTNVVSASGQDLAGQTQAFNAWSEGGVFYLYDPSTPLNDPPFNPVANAPKDTGDLLIIDARNGDGSQLFHVTSASQNGGWDPFAVSGAAHTRQVYDYYRTTFGRKSLDDNHKNLLTVIHFGQDVDNAFWNGAFMVYGDGGNIFSPLVACLDVAGHEMTHGVIENSAGLKYENQSGALNESFADVFGAMIDRDDWLIGEDCTRAAPGFLRSLSNPEQGLSAQPAHMDDYVNLPNTEEGDHGGVHINSGIPNRAAYLIAEGLSAEGRGASIGRADAEQIYYRALTVYLMASSQFIDARRALLQAAEDLHGAGSTQVAAVAAAWDAVGVSEGAAPDPGDTSPTPTDPVNGADAMLYLSPVGGSYDVRRQQFDRPFSGYDPNLDVGPLNTAPARLTRPAAFTDETGTFIFYVGEDNNLYGVAPDGGNQRLTTTGDVFSIALSPDGRWLAYTSIFANDDQIHVVDLTSGEQLDLAIPPLDYSEASNVAANTVLFPDSLSFDYSSSLILFDVLNCLSTADNPCNPGAGTGYLYWGVGFLDLNTRTFSYPFPSQNPAFDLGFPTFAQNNNFQFVMDVQDRSTPGSVQSTVASVNLNTQTVAAVIDNGVRTTPFFAIPSFWGDDDFVTVLAAVADAAGISAFRIPIDAAGQGNPAAAERLNDFAVVSPLMHRVGQRVFTGELEPNTTMLSFGDIVVGETAQATLTLTNNANRDIDITNIDISGEAFTHNATNTLMPRGASMDITIRFAPVTSGASAETFTLTTDSQAPVAVSLTGNGVRTNTPPIANDDAGTTLADRAITIDVLSNDVDDDGDALSVTQVADPRNGVATNDASSVTYTPNAGFTGADAFTYTISDGTNTALATVTITVNAANDSDGGSDGGSGGGCALTPGASFDPTLVGALALMIAFLGWQSHRKRRSRS